MNAYTNIGFTAALMALSAGAGYGSAVYLRPLQPPQRQAAAAPPPAPIPVPAIRTVSWFTAHAAERGAKVAACRDNPGVGQNDPECRNAETAGMNVGFNSFHDAAKAMLGEKD